MPSRKRDGEIVAATDGYTQEQWDKMLDVTDSIAGRFFEQIGMLGRASCRHCGGEVGVGEASSNGRCVRGEVTCQDCGRREWRVMDCERGECLKGLRWLWYYFFL